MFIQLTVIILITNIITVLIGFLLNNYSYFYGSLLGGTGAILYFLLLIYVSSLIIKPYKDGKVRKRLFLKGFLGFIMKISIFAIAILIAIMVNYNFNSSNATMTEESLRPINWWICFALLALPSINAFLINLPIYKINKKT